MLDSNDTVNVMGVTADGVEVLLGTAPTPLKMKLREILHDCGFTALDDDGSEGSYALVAMENLVEWQLTQGWVAPKLVITPVSGATPPPA